MSDQTVTQAERQASRDALDAQIAAAEARRAAAGLPPLQLRPSGDISTSRIRGPRLAAVEVSVAAPLRPPTWKVTRSDEALSPTAAAVLQGMREEVRSVIPVRRQIIAQHPAPPDVHATTPGHLAKAAFWEARLAALVADTDAAPAAPERPAAAAPSPTGTAAKEAIPPDVLGRISQHVHAYAADSARADEALRRRAAVVAPARASRAVATLRDGAASSEAAVKRVTESLGTLLPQERVEIEAFATCAWEARRQLDRITERAAQLLEMRHDSPRAPLAAHARVNATEVLYEVERRAAEIRRAALAEQAKKDPSLLPGGEPRMQSGGKYLDHRSVDCLRCGSTAGREDGRSRLHTDGTRKLDKDKVPERFAPRDGELCTPCYLNGAPMSVPELKLAQRRARLLEPSQMRFRPGSVGWEEAAAEWSGRERARRGLTSPVEEWLDAPTPFVVQLSPAEVADRRLDEQVEREARRADALEKSQWDVPGDRESDWWDLKFAGMGTEPEPRTDATPEEVVAMETERLAEGRRRLLSVIGVEDPALLAVLETQAHVRLHLAQGSAVRAAWEQTRGITRAELRAAAREALHRRILAPDLLAHHRRLREAHGMILPRDMPVARQNAIRARQINRALADLDVPTLVRRAEAIRAAGPGEAALAAEALLAEIAPALEDTHLQGAIAAPRLAETARQDPPVYHSGVDEAVLPGERRAQGHERAIDRWLGQAIHDGELGPLDPGTAAELNHQAGELNPRREVKEYTPSKASGELPWQVRLRDAEIAAEVAAAGHSGKDRIQAAIDQYRADAVARGIDVGDTFGADLRDRFIESAARQAGFTQPELDRLHHIQALANVTGDPRVFDQLLREAAAWREHPEHNNEHAQLRGALEEKADRLKTWAKHGPEAASEVPVSTAARLDLSDEDRALVARAEAAAAPYLAALDEARETWRKADVPAVVDERIKELAEAARHPDVKAAILQHADPELAELAGQIAAFQVFEAMDAPYQGAMGQIDRAGTILQATEQTRDAAHRAWTEMERTLKAQFSNPERLIARVREMNPQEVRDLAASLRRNPLALTANHPRNAGDQRIPGVSAGGLVEKLDPALRGARSRGVRGLLPMRDQSPTERQARVAAVALETWAETRHRGEETRAWAATQLGLPAETPLARVAEAAQARLAELKHEHGAIISAWEAVSPAPTIGQISRRLVQLDPQRAAVARERFGELLRAAPAAPAAPAVATRLPAQPVMAR